MLVIFNPALIDVMTVPDPSSSQTNERSKRFRWTTWDNIGRTIPGTERHYSYIC